MSETPKVEIPKPVKQFMETAKHIINPEPAKPAAVDLGIKPEAPNTAPNAPKTILYRDGCNFCEEMKRELSQKGLLDKVKMVDVASEEGRRMVIESNIRGVPECVIIDSGTKKTRVCSLEEYRELMEKGQ